MTGAQAARWATGLGVVALLSALTATASGLRPGVAEAPVAERLVPVVATVPHQAPPARRRTAAAGTPVVPAASWVAAAAARTGVPARALTSYGAATLRIQREQPGCRLAWNTLAALGQVESGHGGSAGLDAEGRPVVPVIGPALDGGDYAAIRATEQSVHWHGDVRWDHAIGPLQFIPSTWRDWRADGDEDGRRDPHDLDDAALAAARYLCAAGGDLSTADGWTKAVLAYNHSRDYVELVAATASSYAAS